MKEINYEKRLDARKEEIQYDTHSKIMNIINKELNFSNDTINEFKDMGYTILETIVII